MSPVLIEVIMADLCAQLNALEAQYKADHDVAHLQAQFRLIDADNDGFITKGELSDAMRAEVGGQAESAAGMVILIGDKDNDHRLNIDEFVELAKRAIG